MGIIFNWLIKRKTEGGFRKTEGGRQRPIARRAGDLEE
jgi:hypothetical protein